MSDDQNVHLRAGRLPAMALEENATPAQIRKAVEHVRQGGAILGNGPLYFAVLHEAGELPPRRSATEADLEAIDKVQAALEMTEPEPEPARSIWGMPIYTDDQLAPDTVEIRNLRTGEIHAILHAPIHEVDELTKAGPLEPEKVRRIANLILEERQRANARGEVALEVYVPARYDDEPEPEHEHPIWEPFGLNYEQGARLERIAREMQAHGYNIDEARQALAATMFHGTARRLHGQARARISDHWQTTTEPKVAPVVPLTPSMLEDTPFIADYIRRMLDEHGRILVTRANDVDWQDAADRDLTVGEAWAKAGNTELHGEPAALPYLNNEERARILELARDLDAEHRDRAIGVDLGTTPPTIRTVPTSALLRHGQRAMLEALQADEELQAWCEENGHDAEQLAARAAYIATTTPLTTLEAIDRAKREAQGGRSESLEPDPGDQPPGSREITRKSRRFSAEPGNRRRWWRRRGDDQGPS